MPDEPNAAHGNPAELPRWAWLLFSILLGLVAAFSILAIRDTSDGASRTTGEKSAYLALGDQERCWNNGDLNGFMAHYRKSDELMIQSGGDVTEGWQATYDRYHKKYKADGNEMGQLTFTIDRPEALGPEAVVVRGKWALVKSDGRTHGLFTRLFRRIEGQWKIVSDHTSVADK